MNWANPELWDNVGAVGLAIGGSAVFMMSLVRGWLVPGRYHRDVVADRDAEIAELRKALASAGESNNVLTRTLLEKNATDDVTTRMLVAFREAAEAGR